MKKNILFRLTPMLFSVVVMFLVFFGISEGNANDSSNRKEDILEKKLSQPISCNFEEVEFEDAIKFFAEKTGIGIIVDGVSITKSLKQQEKEKEKINLQIENLAVKEALTRILRPLDMGFRKERGVIYITSQFKLAEIEMKSINRIQNEADKLKALKQALQSENKYLREEAKKVLKKLKGQQ